MTARGVNQGSARARRRVAAVVYLPNLSDPHLSLLSKRALYKQNSINQKPLKKQWRRKAEEAGLPDRQAGLQARHQAALCGAGRHALRGMAVAGVAGTAEAGTCTLDGIFSTLSVSPLLSHYHHCHCSTNVAAPAAGDSEGKVAAWQLRQWLSL